MDTTPTPQEAEQSLAQIRHQQADSFRSGRLPWWYVLGSNALVVIYVLSLDLHSPTLQTIAGVAFSVGTLALVWELRRRAPIRHKLSWVLRHHDRTFTLGLVGFVITAGGAVFFGGLKALTALGAPMPHTLSLLAAELLVLLAAWPLGRWYNRRYAQRVEAQER
jgi:hypothetical protein